MLLGWTSKKELRWFAYSPNMTSGQHTHRLFNRLICKHHDVISVERRMDPFKAKTGLRGLAKVSTKTYFWANLISPHYKPVLPFVTISNPPVTLGLPTCSYSITSFYHIVLTSRRFFLKQNKNNFKNHCGGLYILALHL